jgi:hypothetical protein
MREHLGLRSWYHAGLGVAICKPRQGSTVRNSERRAASTMRALSRDGSAGSKCVSRGCFTPVLSLGQNAS